MKTNTQSKLNQFSKILIEKMFKVQEGETVAITADGLSNKEMIFALEKAVQDAGGKSMIIFVPNAEFDGNEGMKFWPHEALTASLCKVDVWIDAGEVVMLYSDIWETAFRENKKLRYLVLGSPVVDSLLRTFNSFEVANLKNLLQAIRKMVMASKTIHITSANGTDVLYDIDLNYSFDIDDGDYSKPIFGTPPGYVNIIPKKGSMNGTIIFDMLMWCEVSENNKVEFVMKDGIIIEIKGNEAAEKFKTTLTDFDDENMYKISHNMFSLNPGVQQLTGNIAEDERVWGGVDFGFGYTSLMDMPPDGQMAKSHFDGVVEKTTIYLDDIIIVKDGEVCHPLLKPLADKLFV